MAEELAPLLPEIILNSRVLRLPERTGGQAGGCASAERQGLGGHAGGSASKSMWRDFYINIVCMNSKQNGCTFYNLNKNTHQT